MGEWILFAAVVAAAAVAGVLRWKNGRFSEVTDATDAPDDAAGTTAGPANDDPIAALLRQPLSFRQPDTSGVEALLAAAATPAP